MTQLVINTLTVYNEHIIRTSLTLSVITVLGYRSLSLSFILAYQA